MIELIVLIAAILQIIVLVKQLSSENDNTKK